MSAAQQIITIDDISADNAPAIYVAGGLNQFLEAVKAEVTVEVPDLTSRKGRERIASLAARVSKSKAAVEKPGREYLKRLKEMPKVVEAELREFVNSMDALRDTTRQPLTDWEAAEDRRVDGHNDNIQRLKDLVVFAETPTAAHVAQVIADLELVAIEDSWEEFLPEAAQAKDRSLVTLRALLADRTKHEAELAEIAKFNAEKAVREQQERDAAIARAAVEKAQQEAAAAAQAERDAAARREQALIDQAAQAQRDAEQKARDAEAAAANQAMQLRLAEEQAERQRLQAESDRVAAEQRQAEAVERARLAEIARANAAADEMNRQAAAREADKAHKGAIYKTAKEAFMQNGMTEDCARLAVKLIASNMIPAISIKY
jgi:hypothetical protein